MAAFQRLPGVAKTQVGYIAGKTDSPTYEQVCSGSTGHTEAVEVQFDPSGISYRELVQIFFEVHDPTTLNRQGNDRGTQYRSGIYTHSDEQAKIAAEEKANTEAELGKTVVTEILTADRFYPAESCMRPLPVAPAQHCGSARRRCQRAPAAAHLTLFHVVAQTTSLTWSRAASPARRALPTRSAAMADRTRTAAPHALSALEIARNTVGKEGMCSHAKTAVSATRTEQARAIRAAPRRAVQRQQPRRGPPQPGRTASPQHRLRRLSSPAA